MNYISEHRTGLIGTFVTHAVVLALLLYFGFFTSLPLPGEEGILVDFGNSETGIGTEEPAPSESAPLKNQEEKRVEVATPPPPPQKKVSTPIDKEALMTQELEKTVAMESAKRKKVIEKAKDLENEKILKEKRKQETLEKQQQAEAERIQKAEIARQRKEEEQKLALAAAEQRKAGEINTRAKNAFGGSGKGTSDSKSKGQGVTYGTGNQGTQQGTAGANQYGPGGGIGNGVSFSLDGRSAQSLPKPYYPGNEEGIVVVQVTVDKEGIVKKAEAGVKGSNTINQELIAAAKKAALLARFNVDENAPAFQSGTITYRFVLE
ncbi:MAG: cell envelope integrity protein TolA [Bacteroidota bacterium]|nr:cell envelope integrity protein TolA [Bacteroidota bacterium]